MIMGAYPTQLESTSEHQQSQRLSLRLVPAEMELISAHSGLDALALFLAFNAFVHWVLRNLGWDVELGPWTHIFIAAPTMFMLSRITSQSEGHAGEPRTTKRSVKVRPPLLWALVTRVWLFVLGEVPLFGKKQSDLGGVRPGNGPTVRYVGDTQVAFLVPEASSARFIVNGLEWTQVYTDDSAGLAVLYGLCPGTIYESLVVHARLSAPQPIEFNFCTSLTSTSEPKPRKLATPIHDIALESAKELLANERVEVRKYRRESMKRLAALKHDTESMDHKVAAKRKADDRARKRVIALQERVEQLTSEIEAIKEADTDSTVDVAELANEAQRVMLERQSKQQDLDVSVRVWAELQSSKESDVQKLRQRCEKLQERARRLESELAQQAAIRELDIDAFLSHIREQRKIRKNRRARLESDFVQAINKLDSSA